MSYRKFDYELDLIDPLIPRYKTTTFDYNSFEMIFFKGSPEIIYRTLISDYFSKVNPHTVYTSRKNKCIYKTYGEFYIQSVLSRICNGMELKRNNIGLWIKIFYCLLSKGFMSEESIYRIKLYLCRPTIPKFLRSVIFVLIDIDKKKRMKIVSQAFPWGVDGIVNNYIFSNVNLSI